MIHRSLERPRAGPGRTARSSGQPRGRSGRDPGCYAGPPPSPARSSGLSLALVATGLGASRALAAVLLYRLASFWLVAFAGWLVLLWLRRPRARARSRNYAVPRPCRPADRAAC